MLLLYSLYVFMIVLLHADVSSAFTCPIGDFVYRECTSCLAIQGAQQGSVFSDAENFCRSERGSLLEIRDTTDFVRLRRYLEGVRETRGLWVGYQYSSLNVRIAAGEGPVSAVILNNDNYAVGRAGGGVGTCIGIKEGKLFGGACTDLLPFLCQYDHNVFNFSAPEVQLSHESGPVFFGNQSTSNLTADISDTTVSGVEWRRNNAVLAPNQNGFLMDNEDRSGNRTITLVFMNFKDSVHVGTYSLAVTIPLGTFIVATWLVQQAVLGTIINPPRDLSVAASQLAGFECGMILFSPPFQVTWFKDSVQLDIANNSRLHVTPETGTLFIRDVIGSDAGSYHCSVSNAAGTLSNGSASLSVVPEASLGNFGVEFVFISTSPSIPPGQSLVLDILGRSNSVDTTVTELDFLPSLESIGVYRYPGDPVFPVLRISNMTLLQNGETILVRYFSLPNPFPSASVTPTFTVDAAASVNELVTSWNGMQSSSNLQLIPVGSDVTVQCQFSGRPAATLEWYKDGVRISAGITTDISTSVSTLTLTNFQGTSVYQCSVSNQHGADIATVFLCSQSPDGVPGYVPFQVVPDSITSLYMSWSMPVPVNTNPQLVRYNISYQALPGGVVRTQSQGFTVSSMVISGLESNMEYEVTISASSLVGSGPTNTKMATTFANVPTVPISASDILLRYTEDNTAIVIEWGPFLVNNRDPLPVSGYELQYRPTNQETAETVFVSGDELRVTLGDLVDAKNYEVRVRVSIQTQRDPPRFSTGPWSAYVQVSGVIITTTPATATTHPIQGSVITDALVPSRPLSQRLLIIIVVGVVFIVVVTMVVIVIVLCCFCYHRRCFNRLRKLTMHPKRNEMYSESQVEKLSGLLPTNRGTSSMSIDYSDEEKEDQIDIGVIMSRLLGTGYAENIDSKHQLSVGQEGKCSNLTKNKKELLSSLDLGSSDDYSYSDEECSSSDVTQANVDDHSAEV